MHASFRGGFEQHRRSRTKIQKQTGVCTKPTMYMFHCTPDMCKNSFGLISTCHPEIRSYAEYQASVCFSDPSLSVFKPVVLLPHMLNCCAKPVYLT